MITLTVEGMNCGSCARSITKVIQQLEADAKVTIQLAEKKVVVEESELTAEEIIPVINQAGYSATLRL